MLYLDLLAYTSEGIRGSGGRTRPGTAIASGPVAPLLTVWVEHRQVHVPGEAALLVVDSGVERSLEGLDPLSTRRLRHVVSENRRVLDFAAAFEISAAVTSRASAGAAVQR
jgi:hypothetical protein